MTPKPSHRFPRRPAQHSATCPLFAVPRSLVYRGCQQKLFQLLFITSLCIYTRRVNRAHLAPCAAQSPEVMNKSRAAPRPDLSPRSSKRSPVQNHHQDAVPAPPPALCGPPLALPAMSSCKVARAAPGRAQPGHGKSQPRGDDAPSQPQPSTLRGPRCSRLSSELPPALPHAPSHESPAKPQPRARELPLSAAPKIRASQPRGSLRMGAIPASSSDKGSHRRPEGISGTARGVTERCPGAVPSSADPGGAAISAPALPALPHLTDNHANLGHPEPPHRAPGLTWTTMTQGSGARRPHEPHQASARSDSPSSAWGLRSPTPTPTPPPLPLRAAALAPAAHRRSIPVPAAPATSPASLKGHGPRYGSPAGGGRAAVRPQTHPADGESPEEGQAKAEGWVGELSLGAKRVAGEGEAGGGRRHGWNGSAGREIPTWERLSPSGAGQKPGRCRAKAGGQLPPRAIDRAALPLHFL